MQYSPPHPGIGERTVSSSANGRWRPLFKANTPARAPELLEADSNLPLAEVDPRRHLHRDAVGRLAATPASGGRMHQRAPRRCSLSWSGSATPRSSSPWRSPSFCAGLEAAGLNPDGSLGLPDHTDLRDATLRRHSSPRCCAGTSPRVLHHEPLVRAGSATAVHEMRVAARHLDVLLRLFTGYGPRWATTLRAARSRTLIKLLGAVRDGGCAARLSRNHVGRLAALGDADRAAIEPAASESCPPARARRAAPAALARFEPHASPGWSTGSSNCAYLVHREQRARAPEQGACQPGSARSDSVDSAEALRKRADAIDETHPGCGGLPRSAHSRQAAARYALRCLRHEPVRRCERAANHLDALARLQRRAR